MFLNKTVMLLQISPGHGDEDKDEDEVFGAECPDPERVNRSSSFLFDSLYDSSLLADLSPHGPPDRLDEEERGDEERPPLSTQERRRSELLANQEAERQEAVQWGESSFNLSEWGDSLLVAEHFLDRQSSLRHKERTQRDAQRHSAEQAPPGEDPSAGHMQPRQNTSAATATESRCSSDKAGDDQTKQTNYAHKDDMTNEGSENGKEIKKRQELNNPSADVKPPQQNPESSFYCSPGLQEILDHWPSMSEQTWQSTPDQAANPQTSAAGAQDPAQPSLEEVRRTDSVEERPVTHAGEDVTERPGSAGDLIPPTQETPPVTPRVKLTTLCVRSPLTVKPLNQSTPTSLLPQTPAVATGRAAGHRRHLSEAATCSSKQPDSTPERSHNKPLPVPRSSSKAKPPIQPEQDLSSPRARPSAPPSAEADGGFRLQPSQDVALSSSDSGTFTIIDVASDRRLFDTFIKEWKSKQRYSLAVACERREQELLPQGEIGGKHKRG